MKKFIKVVSMLIMFNIPSFLVSARSSVEGRGQIVLKLPYRGAPICYQKNSKPESIALFRMEGLLYSPSFVASDWQGNIYIMDVYDIGWGVLKCFDSKGKFLEEWEPVETVTNTLWLNVGVTKDGYIWVTPHTHIDTKREGLPLLAYRHGLKRAILDWRKKLPDYLNEAINESFFRKGVKKEAKRKSQKGRAWMGCGIKTSGEEVKICFFSEEIFEMPQGCILELTLKSDGSKVLRVEIEEAKELKEGSGKQIFRFSYLAPDGREWFVEKEYNLIGDKIYCKKVWIWRKGMRKGKPLFDAEKGKEAWVKMLKIGNGNLLRKIYIDAKGQIYLIWQKSEASDLIKKFLIEGKELDVGGTFLTKQSVVILSEKGSLLSYVPWTTCWLESGDTWIQPLPDGSGFYRMEFSEREARVYFHPLPK